MQTSGVIVRDSVWREIDLSPESDLFDECEWTSPTEVSAALNRVLGDRSGVIGVIRHLSPLMVRSARRQPGADEPQTLLVGLGFLLRVDDTLCTPAAGSVVDLLDDGGLVIEYAGVGENADVFRVVWWGLQNTPSVGTSLASGAVIGSPIPGIGEAGLGPMVQVQLLAADDASRPPQQFGRHGDRAESEIRDADPAAFLGWLGQNELEVHLTAPEVVALRDVRLARSQRAYYDEPPRLVRGRGVWLYDENGLGYLDTINNVTHVGHAEPRVAAAAIRQMQRLNTNSRFIYEGIATYAERIVATLPAPLEVVFFVCTGSEANDLALRISRQVTGREDVVVLDGAYHGNTAAVMGVSPNRYKGRGGRGAPPTTHEVMTPDVYRGPYGRDDPDAGAKYGAHAARLIEGLVEQGRAPAAFIAESLMGTAGNIVFPTGFLHTAFAAARAAGTICIADEVQIGVGRLGTHFWGFQAQGVVPDIVTMGKPLGNGHPIAAVVTTREIADAFDDGVKYFNTFAGSPVSCAIGNAVMDIVQGDELQANALDVGSYLLDLLLGLKSQHELIGDVRGHGLYLGVEFVRNRETKEPAAAEAMSISERLKDHGIITYPNGIYDNVLKIKPPMIFNREHADLFTEVLGDILHRFPRG
jgi:4-aminobutyrate aminotransferase-like enzyme